MSASIVRMDRASGKQRRRAPPAQDVIDAAPVTRHAPLGAVVLAAGLGTRMRSCRAKVLHELAGLPLLHYPLAALRPLDPTRVVVVVGHQADDVTRAAEASGLPGLTSVLQAEQNGTGHAVSCAAGAMADFEGDVLILYGDVPLVTTRTLAALVDAHRARQADLSLLTMRFPDPTGYGRIVRGSDGQVTGIVEQKDATEAERAITEVNPGFYCVRASLLFPLLGRLRSDNAQGELYLTDVVGLAARDGKTIVSVETERPHELSGINTRAELARAESLLRAEIVERWMDAGVTFEDPATAYVGAEVEIGPETIIGPNVTLRGRTRLGKGCRLDGTAHIVDSVLGDGVRLRFACDLEGAVVGADAIVGPFARLRPGTELGAQVHIGNFVETKKAVLGKGTKANHLTYLGDCEIGPETNVGAGTITCNYDGFAKHRTRIGARVQIGSDTQLVAPVSVADDAYVAAGTTVTRDVPAGALAVSRVPVRFIEGWTARKRATAKGEPATKTASRAKTRSAQKTGKPRSAKPSVKARPVTKKSGRRKGR
jgi:bifunctional UDP-N-acetylglucosamine pyrophosphorylase/glucosamine-1-phosphate N-acetyltransferase